MPGRNGGQLRRGGPNGGAGGRPPKAIKAIAKKELRKRIPLLGHFADGVAVSLMLVDGEQKLVTHAVDVSDRIAAIRELGKLADDGKVDVHEVKRRMAAQVAVIRERDTWTSDELLEELNRVWA
jgi:hypothetical protein